MNTIELGDGIRLEPPTEEALEYIERNFREGDAMEHDFFGGSLKCPEGQPAWVIRHGEKIIGVGGFNFPSDGGYLSDMRVAWFLSTTNANAEKKFFVRHSKEVFKAMVDTLPDWVKGVYAAPMMEYTGALRWLTKVLGFTTEYKTILDGAEFVVLKKMRKEI